MQKNIERRRITLVWEIKYEVHFIIKFKNVKVYTLKFYKVKNSLALRLFEFFYFNRERNEKKNLIECFP